MHGIVIIHTNAPPEKNLKKKKKSVFDKGKELKYQTNMRRKEMENPQANLYGPAVTPWLTHGSRTLGCSGSPHLRQTLFYL